MCKNFSYHLLDWYHKNKRDLPWRTTTDPYTIWVSEIILQQTRIDQGLGYFNRFMERFPDVHALSSASEDEVLKIWKGLGYYSRARNMHVTAMFVRDSLNAVFPSDFETLIKLKGIGHYTAAAISSICAGEARPVVDGNVVRVITRLYGFNDQVGSSPLIKRVAKICGTLMDRSNPGDFNQAMMEFGAIQCKPHQPACHGCIFSSECYAFRNEKVEDLPVKKPRLVKRNRFLNYLCIPVKGRGVIMTRRSGNDIWRNLWELPLFESDRLLTAEAIRQTNLWHSLRSDKDYHVIKSLDFKHILTHQVIHARFFILKTELQDCDFQSENGWIIDRPTVSGLPVSRLTERFLEQAGHEIYG